MDSASLASAQSFLDILYEKGATKKIKALAIKGICDLVDQATMRTSDHRDKKFGSMLSIYLVETKWYDGVDKLFDKLCRHCTEMMAFPEIDEFIFKCLKSGSDAKIMWIIRNIKKNGLLSNKVQDFLIDILHSSGNQDIRMAIIDTLKDESKNPQVIEGLKLICLKTVNYPLSMAGISALNHMATKESLAAAKEILDAQSNLENLRGFAYGLLNEVKQS